MNKSLFWGSVLLVLFSFGVAEAATKSKNLPPAAQPQQPESTITLPDFRMQKRFGFGISAAGPLSVLGFEFDINISENFSVGGGLGTGIDYTTMMLKGRYFLLGKSVSPYFGGGIARWYTDGTKESDVSPSVLKKKFLDAGQDLSKGFEIFILYPVVGVQFMHPTGFAVFAEIQWFFKMMSMANGSYAGLGMHWYF